jgi:pimeloyl-ACP methyl ester carboxylesterase
VLAPHLQRLGPPPPGVRIEPHPQPSQACAERLWAALWAGRPAAAAPPPKDCGLPPSHLGDAHVHRPGLALHLRGACGGPGRPLVLLHPSPGGPRSLEAQLQRRAGRQPVLAPSLPGHGESMALTPLAGDGLLDALDQGLLAAGITEADLVGSGASAALAVALAARRPGRWHCHSEPAACTASQAPGPFTPRDDGGHLFAAWQHARDESVLGPWWQRAERHPCADAIDVPAVQRHAVEVLKEGPAAAAWRAARCTPAA